MEPDETAGCQCQRRLVTEPNKARAPSASLAILLVAQGAAYGIFIISRRDTYVFLSRRLFVIPSPFVGISVLALLLLYT